MLLITAFQAHSKVGAFVFSTGLALGTKNTKLAIVSFKFVLIQILDNCVICALQTSVSNFNHHELFLGLIEKFFIPKSFNQRCLLDENF
jgi:hypothetical protein